jgi:hypothetical protein
MKMWKNTLQTKTGGIRSVLAESEFTLDTRNHPDTDYHFNRYNNGSMTCPAREFVSFTTEEVEVSDEDDSTR